VQTLADQIAERIDREDQRNAAGVLRDESAMKELLSGRDSLNSEPRLDGDEVREARMVRRFARLILVCLCSVVASCAAVAQSVDAFYKSKGLTIVCGFSPGSIYDMYARVIAAHIQKHIPGEPNVIVKNMPGAGSLTAANYIANIAPKDGSQIATFSRSIVTQQLLGDHSVQFDAARMNWIGTPSSEVSVVFSWYSKPFKTVQDIIARQMVVPASGPGGNSAVFPYVMNGLLGTKFKVVIGYPGAAEENLAIERGEADGSGATSWGNLVSSEPDWLRDKKINVIMQLSTKKLPVLGDVPLVVDLAKNEIDKQALELVFSTQVLAYPYVAPPGIPADRARALSQAFDSTMKDPEFVADARGHNLEVDPLTGNEATGLIKTMYSTSPQVIARLIQAVQEGKQNSESR
jgi:tripartite-type tricarboxylate transporter receptor subunit TctC